MNRRVQDPVIWEELFHSLKRVLIF
jgi:hypothetical protein